MRLLRLQNHHMKRHVKQVHEGKCYKCNICGAIVKNLSQHMISIHEIKKRIKNPIVIDEGCGSSNQKKTTSDDQPQTNSPMPNDIQILLGLSPSLLKQQMETGSPTSDSNPTSNNNPTADGSQKPEGHFIVLNVEHIKMWKDILEKYVNYPCICDKDDISNVTKEMSDVLKLIKY